MTSRRVANNPIRPRGALFRSRLPQFKPLATPAAVMRAAGYPHCHRLTEDIDHDTTKVRKKNRADFLPTGTAARWMFSLTSQEVAAGISRFVRKAHNYAEMAAGLNGHRSPVAVGHTTSKVRVVRSDDYGVRSKLGQRRWAATGSEWQASQAAQRHDVRRLSLPVAAPTETFHMRLRLTTVDKHTHTYAHARGHTDALSFVLVGWFGVGWLGWSVGRSNELHPYMTYYSKKRPDVDFCVSSNGK